MSGFSKENRKVVVSVSENVRLHLGVPCRRLIRKRDESQCGAALEFENDVPQVAPDGTPEPAATETSTSSETTAAAAPSKPSAPLTAPEA